MIEAYLSSQLQTFVAIVISVVHLVIPLSQDHPPHHHSQVNTLGPKVKLFNLKTNYNFLETIRSHYIEYIPTLWSVGLHTGTCVRISDASSSLASSILVFLGPPHMRCLRTLFPRYLRAWDTEQHTKQSSDLSSYICLANINILRPLFLFNKICRRTWCISGE